MALLSTRGIVQCMLLHLPAPIAGLHATPATPPPSPACPSGPGAAAAQGAGGRQPGGHEQHEPGPEGKPGVAEPPAAAAAAAAAAAGLFMLLPSTARLPFCCMLCPLSRTVSGCRCPNAPPVPSPCAAAPPPACSLAGLCADCSGSVPGRHRPVPPAAAAEHGRWVAGRVHAGLAAAAALFIRGRRADARSRRKHWLLVAAAPNASSTLCPAYAGDSAGELDAAGVSPAVRMLQQNTRLGEALLPACAVSAFQAKWPGSAFAASLPAGFSCTAVLACLALQTVSTFCRTFAILPILWLQSSSRWRWYATRASQLWCRCSSLAQQARQRRKQARQRRQGQQLLEQQIQQSSKTGSRQQSSRQQALTKHSRGMGSKRFGGRRVWCQVSHWPATQVSISAVAQYQCIRGIGELTGSCFQLCEAHPHCAKATHFWSPPDAVRLARCDSKDAQQRAAAVRLLIRCGACTPLGVDLSASQC